MLKIATDRAGVRLCLGHQLFIPQRFHCEQCGKGTKTSHGMEQHRICTYTLYARKFGWILILVLTQNVWWCCGHIKGFPCLQLVINDGYGTQLGCHMLWDSQRSLEVVLEAKRVITILSVLHCI